MNLLRMVRDFGVTLPLRSSEWRGRETAPLNVLVVEDDADLRDLLKEILMLHGYSVESAGDGIEAEKIASGRRYDVFVIDVRLPGCDGFELIRRLTRNGSPPKVILISAFMDVWTTRRGLDSGVGYMLQKPLNLERLAVLVGKIGGGGHRRSSTVGGAL